MAEALVQIRALAKRFESRKGLFGKRRSLSAVSDVTLDIPRGKVTGGWAWRHHRRWLRELVTGKTLPAETASENK